MDIISYLLHEYAIGCNAVFFAAAIHFLKSNEDDFRRDRRRNHLRAYRRDGALVGGVVMDRKTVGDKQMIQYAYRLPLFPDTIYVKDFVEAPKELKEDHKNIIIALHPRRSKSGIHYGLLQKLMQSKEVAKNGNGIAYKGLLRLCFLQGVMALWSTLGPSFFWTSQMLLYAGLFQIWRIHKTEEKSTGVTEGVWKTLKRDLSDEHRSLYSPLLEPLKSDELDDDTSFENTFMALEKAEEKLGRIMNSFDPESEKYGNAFPCEKYFYLVPRCQPALQKDGAIFDT
ncbi:MAG: hypothetical protein SGBAC_006028 [Bacillariaceae sp.]